MFVTLGHITLEHVTLRHVTIRMSPCDKSYQEVTPLNTVLKLINQFIFFNRPGVAGAVLQTALSLTD